MPKLTVLPHPEYCPEGAVIEDAPKGVSICRVLLDNHIDIEHACELSCACTTCHVVVKQGYSSLEDATDDEEDLLDKAWGLTPTSRLSCQALVTDAFDTDKEGKINRSKIFMLLRHSIEDERWQRAMDAIRDAMRVTGSKEYVRFYTRQRPEDGWQAITIDLARV